MEFQVSKQNEKLKDQYNLIDKYVRIEYKFVKNGNNFFSETPNLLENILSNLLVSDMVMVRVE